mgnify:CR=1 FL=1
MYGVFYGLREDPFNVTPDPAFLFFSGKHQDTFATILDGITRRRGFMAITGSIGTGKTTLCRALLERLGDEVRSALVINPSLSPLQLLQTIMEDFEIVVRKQDRKGYFDALNGFLMDVARRGSTAILILDEAQDLAPSTLEEIRLLSNFETNKKKLLQVILVGQPELGDLLAKPSMAQVRQRITVWANLAPLDREETEQYIAHRIWVAGGQGMLIFDSDAVDEIFLYSQGVPRMINIICDNVLSMDFTRRTGARPGDSAEEAGTEQMTLATPPGP